MKNTFILLSLLLFSMAANSALVTHTSTIKAIDQHTDGTWVMTFDSDHASCTNQSLPSKFYYVRVGQEGVTADSSKSLLSVAMAAAMAQKTVHVVFNDVDAGCYVSRIIVSF